MQWLCYWKGGVSSYIVIFLQPTLNDAPPVTYFICLGCTFYVLVRVCAIFCSKVSLVRGPEVCMCFYLLKTKIVTLFSIQTVNAILWLFICHFQWPIHRFSFEIRAFSTCACVCLCRCYTFNDLFILILLAVGYTLVANSEHFRLWSSISSSFGTNVYLSTKCKQLTNLHCYDQALNLYVNIFFQFRIFSSQPFEMKQN